MNTESRHAWFKKKIHKEVSAFIRDPNKINELKLKTTFSSYREFVKKSGTVPEHKYDEHEVVMNYR